MKTFAEVAEWCGGAAYAFGDPSVPVCQLFFRWVPDLRVGDGGDDDDTLVCGMLDREFLLMFTRGGPLPLPIRSGEPEASDEGVITYGAVRVVEGVWAFSPSLNIPGFIHGFVVVYGVPDPAPWERLIVLAEAL